MGGACLLAPRLFPRGAVLPPPAAAQCGRDGPSGAEVTFPAAVAVAAAGEGGGGAGGRGEQAGGGRGAAAARPTGSLARGRTLPEQPARRSLGGNGEGRPRAALAREGGRGCEETTGRAGRCVGRGAVVTAAVRLSAREEPSRSGRRVIASGA